MNKSELISHVMDTAELSKADATSAVDAVIGGITQAMSQGDSVSLVGFGTFTVTDRAARTARNPRTGESIEVAAAKVAKFKPGKALKDTVNQK